MISVHVPKKRAVGKWFPDPADPVNPSRVIPLVRASVGAAPSAIAARRSRFAAPDESQEPEIHRA